MDLLTKRTKLVLESKYILLQLIEKNNMMYLPLFKEALNMEKFTIKNKITRLWHKFTNPQIIVNSWLILPNQ